MSGTCVSSIFNANDKQATAGNCIVQALAYQYNNWLVIVDKSNISYTIIYYDMIN